MRCSTSTVPDRGTLLVTGAAGQLGRAVATACAPDWQVIGLGRAQFDLGQPEALLPLMRELQPSVVVNCAALTDTGRCEREPAQADLLNSRAPAALAAACRATGSYLVQISTNEVFDGEADSPYHEDAPTRPLSAYARSKRAGEELVLAAAPDALVLRTAWLYGAGAQNFVQRVLGWAARQPTLSVVTDEVATPTACTSVAAAICELVRQRPRGLLHVTDGGSASRFAWAREILRLSGADPDRVRPALLADFPDAVPKPRYSVLSTARAESLGVRTIPWQSAFAAFMAARTAEPA